MRTIMGFSEYRVVKGQILFNGEDITSMPVDERARRGLGIMMQRPPDMSGIKLKDLVRVASKGKKNPETLAEELGMEHFLDRDVNVGFSGGEIKRSELLQLAAQDPDFYLLDEPESGVDLVSIEQVGMTIKELLEEGMNCPGERCERGKICPYYHPYRSDLGLCESRQGIYPLQWDGYVFRKSPEDAGRNKEKRV